MSDVRLARRAFDLAELGEENPLPDFQNISYVHSTVTWDDSLTPEDTRYMRYGRVSSILPYMAQDGYTRSRKETLKDVIIVENSHVRAEFLPWMGGRLRSLVCGGRELLYVNPVVQPCNLALRNAWCSGGVEWNVSVRGHNMLTNEPLFAEALRLPDGTAGVRMYEYERIRGVVYRLEAYLPPESRFLYVQVHIENPAGNGERPMYWWSNIAVPERPGTRVIAPADTAILSLYDAGSYRMLRVALPRYEETDLSRPTEIGRSLDVFFDIRPSVTPFVTALQEDHTGLVQCSTGFMRGRKLFVWGMGQGGRHWQQFLSDGSSRYIEIQAGIAKTQQDHLPMPENTTWSWLEAYGSLTCDVDGLSYADAAAKCAAALEREQSGAALEAEKAGRGREIAAARGEPLLAGSGWGALENARRRKAGLPPVSPVCRFPAESMGEAQAPWRQLLETGVFPDAAPLAPPRSCMLGADWQRRLAGAPENSASAYQLGVMLYAAGQADEAFGAFRRSLEHRTNPWALRALARIRLLRGETDACLAAYREALALLPAHRQLCLEYAQTLRTLGLNAELRAYLDALEPALRRRPRFQYLQAAADIALADYAEAERILLGPLVIPDMREGELSLCELWFELYQRRDGLSREEAERLHPLPMALDFRMH